MTVRPLSRLSRLGPRARILFALGVLIFLPLVLYGIVVVVVNLWGAWEYRNTVAELKAAGKPVTQRDLEGPVPADEDNFYMHPWFDVYREASLQPKDPVQNRLHEAKQRNGARMGLDAHEGRHAVKCASNFLLGHPTQFIPWATVTVDPPVPILTEEEALKLLDRIIAEKDAPYAAIMQASRRHQARMPRAEGLLMTISVTHLMHLRVAVNGFKQRASVRLAQGRPAEALEEVLTALRLANLVRQDRLTISKLIAIAMEAIIFSAVWEGCVRGQWTEAELTALQQALAPGDPLKDFQDALELETVAALEIRDALRKDPDQLFSLGSSEKGLRPGAGKMVPGGLHDLMAARAARSLSCLRDLAETPNPGRINLVALQKYTESLQTRSNNPAEFFTIMMTVPLSRFGPKLVQIENYRSLLRIMVAMERFRLAEGRFPQTPDELVPQYLDALPACAATGKPVQMKWLEDGTWVLWFPRGDGVDHGGKPPLNAAGDVDFEAGDICLGNRIELPPPEKNSARNMPRAKTGEFGR